MSLIVEEVFAEQEMVTKVSRGALSRVQAVRALPIKRG